jgi:hypothetical protein
MRYRTRVLEIEACPSPIWLGEFAAIIGPEFHHLAADLFHALFEKITEPPRPSDDLLAPVILAVVNVPLPLPGSVVPALAPPAVPPLLGHVDGHAPYSKPWTCSHGHAAVGRACPTCHQPHPTLAARTAS